MISIEPSRSNTPIFSFVSTCISSTVPGNSVEFIIFKTVPTETTSFPNSISTTFEPTLNDVALVSLITVDSLFVFLKVIFPLLLTLIILLLNTFLLNVTSLNTNLASSPLDSIILSAVHELSLKITFSKYIEPVVLNKC